MTMKIVLAFAASCALLLATGAAAQEYELVEQSPGEYLLKYKNSSTLPQRLAVPGIVVGLEMIPGGDMYCPGNGSAIVDIFDFRTRLTHRLSGQTALQLQDLLKALDGQANRSTRFAMLFQIREESGDVLPITNKVYPTHSYRFLAGATAPQQRGEATRLLLSPEACLTPAQIDAAIDESKRVIGLVIQALQKSQ
jgi:hypothetical protein